MEKEYKIIFTDDYLEYEKWAKEGGSNANFWANNIKNNPGQLEMCRKWSGKTIKFSELPEFVKEVGDVILGNGDEIEVYNGYRE